MSETPSPSVDATRAARAAILLLGCCAALAAVGFVSAASVAPPGELAAKLRAHGTSLAVALFAFLVALRVPLETLRRAAPWIAAAVGVLLIAVLVPSIGRETKGGRRWLSVLGYSMQPSELAKVALILFLADFIGRAPERLTDLAQGFLPAAAVGLGLAGLVLPEPDFGTALYLVVLAGVLLAVGGAPTPYLIGSALVALPGVVITAFLRFGHVRSRSTGDLQVLQSLRALGEGGLLGVGYGAGRMKLGHVPEGHNDFILALLGEEWGLLGTSALILLFGGILVAGARGASACREPFARLIAFGVPFAIVLQAVFNIAVVTGTAPPKGIALPFVSSGGSALLGFSTALGLAANVLRREAQRAGVERAAVESFLRFAPLPDSTLEVRHGQP